MIERCEPVPCPSFEEAALEVTGSAPVGHRVVDGFETGDHETADPNTCAVCLAALGEIVAEAQAVVDEEITRGLEAAAPRHVHLDLRRLPEGAAARMAEMTRHPQCVITGQHEPHNLIHARTSGFRCGGDPRPSRA